MAKQNKYPNILCIGDPHARPDQDNSRFEILGKFAVDKKPDIIVCIGDFADMESLNSYDKWTVKAEGKRYKDDLISVIDAQEKMFAPIRKEMDRLVTNKKKRWEPKFYMTMGNHENRINRAANENPSLYGHMSVDDLKYKEYGWEVVPFLKPLVLHNIAFQHYFTSGVMGRPISGDNHAATLVKKNFMSSVCGHSHLRDYWETTDIIGRKKFGLVLGCYDEGDHSYANGTQHQWWSGLTMLNRVEDGQAEPAFWSLKYLKERYS